ncbi:capsular exopolysaccharide family [Alkalidesulfovibrio alkalitolerans DSM 16529]|jgi:exopolysaccharide/PEP-CTERM locus tyrosine autokinase|uniref:Capsular exopolysaccharide family n=1 Tax=Alkalidesulfovibrio alkalitolerans DSM 16529 TaxID=1121439 RepID=S7UE93_9BACT|nr:XrtA-associated tyrosine autokinase [Alkalidesulfovibrio alkalitolerans]EPR30553.1 capsular exopolysaccharide family [Alkalidesulfovibrio alkalitolerans DSM 16529]
MSRIEEALAKAANLNTNSGPGLERSGRHGRKVGRSPLVEPQITPVQQVPEPTLVTINAPLSPMAEEYRKLKEALVKMTKRERFDNLIAVTSATVGEGKSMTAINLAASLAQEYDHTVLLVDADLRRPVVHKYLGFEQGKGLSDCLIEGRDVSEVLVKTNIGKLVVLPAGTSVPNPAELFSSEAMRNLFMEMKGRYSDRYIIVDTPPVLPFAESRSMAGIADGVLLVVKEGQPSVEQVQEAIDALQNKVLGIVYNGAHMSKSSNGYYYYAK